MSEEFIKNAKISKKGQVTIPAEVRNLLGVKGGDYIAFGKKESNIVIVNREEVKISEEKEERNVQFWKC